MYLCWYDDNGKKDVAQKLAEGAAAYAQRFGCRPTVAVVSLGEQAELDGATVITRGYVRPHHFWFGMEAPE